MIGTEEEIVEEVSVVEVPIDNIRDVVVPIESVIEVEKKSDPVNSSRSTAQIREINQVGQVVISFSELMIVPKYKDLELNTERQRRQL